MITLTHALLAVAGSFIIWALTGLLLGNKVSRLDDETADALSRLWERIGGIETALKDVSAESTRLKTRLAALESEVATAKASGRKTVEHLLAEVSRLQALISVQPADELTQMGIHCQITTIDPSISGAR